MAFKPFMGKKEEEKKSNSVETKTERKIPVKTDEPPVAVQLENAMDDNSRQDTPDSRSRVYQELLFSDLLLALVDGPQPPQSSENPEAAQNINVAIMSNPQGVQFAAAFTSAEAAKRWRAEGGQYVSIRGQDIFKLLEPSPAEVIVINPASSPFVVLPKAEYRSLANGVVPQSPQSPVQAVPKQAEGQQAPGMQISFPPDAFNDNQKADIASFLKAYENIEAAALGALLPPGAQDENNWLRTIFLRTKQLPGDQAQIQKFCIDIRDAILNTYESMKGLQFEVGVMPDENFWVAIHKNNFTLFDFNPPKEATKPSTPVMNPPGARRA